MDTEDHAEQRESRFGALRHRIELLIYRVQSASALAYMGAASLIGIEAVALLVGFTTVLPIAIPFVVLALGGAYFFRERLRAAWTRLTGRGSDRQDEAAEEPEG